MSSRLRAASVGWSSMQINLTDIIFNNKNRNLFLDLLANRLSMERLNEMRMGTCKHCNTVLGFFCDSLKVFGVISKFF